MPTLSPARQLTGPGEGVPGERPILNNNPAQQTIIVYVATDSLKREGAGTVLPIKITGTREVPSLRVELGKALKREE
jgi:hypothetical protein